MEETGLGQTALPVPALPANPKSPTELREDKAEDSGDLEVIEPPEKKARKSLEEEMGKLMEGTREGYDLTAAALDKVQQHLDISRQTSKDIAQLAQEVHCEKVGAEYQLAQLQYLCEPIIFGGAIDEIYSWDKYFIGSFGMPLQEVSLQAIWKSNALQECYGNRAGNLPPVNVYSWMWKTHHL